MTTPSPAPQTGAQSQALKDAGLINLPTVGTGSGSGSKFGLDAAVASSKVNLGGLAALLNLPASATADQVMQAFASAKDPRVIAKIQAYMQAARMYSASTNVNMGVVTAADIDAFKTVVKTAAQTGADLGDYLTRSAQFGAYTGLAASMTGKQTPIKTGAPDQVAALADKYYQQDTGRNATAKEKAAFLVAYNAAYKNFQEQQIQAENTPVTAGDPNYNTAPPAPITGAPDAATGATFSDHLSSDGPALTAAQDQANLSQIPTQATVSQPSEPDSFSPDAFAEQYVRQHNGGEASAHDVTQQFGTFLSILQNGHP